MQRHRKYKVAKSLDLFGRNVLRPMTLMAVSVGDETVKAWHQFYLDKGYTAVHHKGYTQYYK